MILIEFCENDYLPSKQVLSQTVLYAHMVQPLFYQAFTAIRRTALTSIRSPFRPRTHLFKQLQRRVEHPARNPCFTLLVQQSSGTERVKQGFRAECSTR